MTSPESPTNAPKIRVLIVDDVPETRRNLARMLHYESSVEVVGAAIDGLEGVNMAVAHQPHIVLMDVNMPELDGITACERIKKRGLSSNVIMMSVQGYPDHLRRAMIAGAKDFLMKPFSSDELLASIRRVTRIGPVTRATTAVIYLPRKKTKVFIISDRADKFQHALAQAREIEVLGTAANGAVTLSTLGESTPDIVLIEADPGVDGLIMAQRVAEQTASAQPLLLVPNQAEADYLARSRFANGAMILAQPFTVETLIQAIQAVHQQKIS